MLTTQTHDYDGCLPPLPRPPSLSLDECLEAVRKLTTDSAVHQALDLLSDPATNYDPANNLNACDVFRLAWELVREQQCLPSLLEQLSDIIHSGSCVQGRTTRLYQLISCCVPTTYSNMSTSIADGELVGLHSLAGSGKTTTAKILKELRAALEYAFAWPLKKVCGELYTLTWEQMEDPVLKVTPIARLNGVTPRYILQKFGTELVRKHHKEALPLLPYESLWLDLGKEWIRNNSAHFRVVSDARFDNEITAIHEARGYVLGIERLSCAASAGTHESEQVLFHLCDGVVTNNGTLEEFHEKLKELFSTDASIRERARKIAAAERVPAQTRANIIRTRKLLAELTVTIQSSGSELALMLAEEVKCLQAKLEDFERRLPFEEECAAATARSA